MMIKITKTEVETEGKNKVLPYSRGIILSESSYKKWVNKIRKTTNKTLVFYIEKFKK